MESYTINLLKDIASDLAKVLSLGFTAAHWIINTKDDKFRTGEIIASSSTQTHNKCWVGTWVGGLELQVPVPVSKN